jgi:hypothetical protein
MQLSLIKMMGRSLMQLTQLMQRNSPMVSQEE